jgi:hypothetical protein
MAEGAKNGKSRALFAGFLLYRSYPGLRLTSRPGLRVSKKMERTRTSPGRARSASAGCRAACRCLQTGPTSCSLPCSLPLSSARPSQLSRVRRPPAAGEVTVQQEQEVEPPWCRTQQARTSQHRRTAQVSGECKQMRGEKTPFACSTEERVVGDGVKLSVRPWFTLCLSPNCGLALIGSGSDLLVRSLAWSRPRACSQA